MRSRRFPNWIVLLALVYPGALPSLLIAQQAWSIIGVLQTSRGELPDQPILVTLQFRGSTIETTYSDSGGKFAFYQLSPNAYHVIVADEKYRAVDQMVEINPMITMPTLVHINLSPKEAASRESLASGSNPNLVNSVTLKQLPTLALKEFDKGIKSDKDGRKDEAIRHYEKAVLVAPDFYAARNNLGSAYLAKADFGAAQEQFERVIKANPDDAAAYFNLGNLLLLQEKYVEAVHWLGEGLAREPNSPLGHFLVGSAFTRAGKPDIAEKELRSALQLDPKMSKAHLALVNLYMQENRKTDAVAELRSFLKNFPADPLAPKAGEVLRKLEAGSAEPNH